MSRETNPTQELKLIELLGVAYLLIEQDGQIKQSNALAQTLLGANLVGENFFGFWVDEEKSATFLHQVMTKTEVKGFATELKGLDEHSCLVHVYALWVEAEADSPAHIEVLMSQLSANGEQHEAFNETLRNVSGSIAHLINNKMASVVGTADLLKKELKHNPAATQKLDRITRCGLEASDVTHGLVDYAENLEESQKEILSLSDLIEEVARIYQANTFHEYPRKVSFNIEGKLPAIKGNKTQILTLLSCMLDNAIEATQDDDVIIVSGKEKVLKNKKTGQDQQYVMFSVEDHGVGMDEATQKRIFEPYFSTKFMGRGMSLAIALKIIKEHKGRIHVKTGKGRGSIFKVYFPVVSKD